MHDGKAEAVSNFTCRIHQHIIDQEHPMKLIEIQNEHHDRWVFEVPSEAFLTLLSFKKAVTSRGNFQWTGTEGDYARYLSRMFDHMGQGRMITELGQQPEGFFMFTNAAVNSQVITVDEHGCFQHEGESFYCPAGNVIYQRDDTKHANAKRIRLIKSDISFGRWNEQIRVVHRNHSFTAGLFAIATAFSDHIFDKVSGFPLLFLYGEPGSGKDQLIQACQSLFGRPQPEIFLSGPNTDKGQIRMFAEFANIPLNLAEYKAGMKKEQFEFLKGVWGRMGYRRGNLNGRFSTDTVPIRCTAYVSGNDYPNQDDALITRLIVEEMNKVQFDDGERRSFAKLRQMMEEGYSGALVPILQERTKFAAAWYKEHYQPAQAELDQALTGLTVDGRMETNLAVLLSIHSFFDRMPWAFDRAELLAHMRTVIKTQQEKRQTGNDVAQFWTCFIYAVRAKALRLGEHFRIDGDHLGFYWGEVHSVYLKVHRDVFNENGKNDATLRAKLANHPSWVGPKSSYRIGKRKSSALLFDIGRTGHDLAGIFQEDGALVDDIGLGPRAN